MAIFRYLLFVLLLSFGLGIIIKYLIVLFKKMMKKENEMFNKFEEKVGGNDEKLDKLLENNEDY